MLVRCLCRHIYKDMLCIEVAICRRLIFEKYLEYCIQSDSVRACKNETGHRGCSTEQFEVGNLGSMKLA